ncbi:MAG: hypothetical protein M0Z38_04865 [Deltaproteobacteria bacterium]|nr:hypothetical protein [Deltaproteobacteria bacterium]
MNTVESILFADAELNRLRTEKTALHEAYTIQLKENDRLRAIVARFKEVGIKKDALETHAGKKMEELTAEDLKIYTGLLNAIRDGEISAEEALGIKKEEKPAETVKPGISVAGPGNGTSTDSRTEQGASTADVPPVDLSKSTPPEKGELPFADPAAKKDDPPAPPKDPIAELIKGRTLLLEAAGKMTILNAVWSEIVKDERIPGIEKAKLQEIYDRKKKELGS